VRAMRSLLALAALSCVANAGFVKQFWDLNGRDLAAPRETGAFFRADESQGWTPKPTAAPGGISESEAVLELLKRGGDKRATNTFENAHTCGWYADQSCE
jgi:hypothetical protein